MNIKHYVKRMKKTNKQTNRIISADGEKSCDKIQYPFMIKKKKTFSKLVIENYLNITKLICERHTDTIIVSGEALKAFPQRSVTRNKCPLLPHLFNH